MLSIAQIGFNIDTTNAVKLQIVVHNRGQGLPYPLSFVGSDIVILTPPIGDHIPGR